MEALNKFGEILIKDVRDCTINEFDRKLAGAVKSERAQLLSDKMNKCDSEAQEFINEIIPVLVDLSLHKLLCMVEENDSVAITIDGQDVAEISDGLAGELYGDYGWIKNYSEERIVED